jgi:hypothetical protein
VLLATACLSRSKSGLISTPLAASLADKLLLICESGASSGHRSPLIAIECE